MHPNVDVPPEKKIKRSVCLLSPHGFGVIQNVQE